VFRFDGTGEPAIVTIEGVYEDLKALREVGKIKPLLEFPVFRTIFGTRSQRPRPDQDIWVEMSSTKCLYYVYLVGDVSDAEVLFAAVNAAGGKGFSITCDDQEINAAALRHFGSW
jgi:hypothetical protein